MKKPEFTADPYKVAQLGVFILGTGMLLITYRQFTKKHLEAIETEAGARSLAYQYEMRKHFDDLRSRIPTREDIYYDTHGPTSPDEPTMQEEPWDELPPNMDATQAYTDEAVKDIPPLIPPVVKLRPGELP